MRSKKRIIAILLGLIVAGVLVAQNDGAVRSASASDESVTITATRNIVISQIYGGGGTTGAKYGNSFIELFNRGNTTVDLNGWSLAFTSETGTFSSTTTFTSTRAITISPGQYLLVIFVPGGFPNGAPVNPYDYSIFGTLGTSGKVILLQPGAAAPAEACPLSNPGVADFVGFGNNANCFEGTGPAPTLNNTTAAIRNGSGCTDTDNNAADFTTGTPNPHNSSSLFNSCINTTPPPTVTIKQLSLPTTDLVFDSVTQKIYASVPGSATSGGNSITPIDPATGTLGTPVSIGKEPSKLALSDDGQYLYVALDGEPSVRRFNLSSQTADLQFALGSDVANGPYYAGDMAVMPGHPQTVALVRRLKNSSPSYVDVAIFDDNTMRPSTTMHLPGQNDIIEFSDSPEVLYGQESGISSTPVHKLSAGACGVTMYSNEGSFISGPGVDFKYDNGLIYTSRGLVINPETGATVGTFSSAGFDPLTPVAPDSKSGRAYFLTGIGSSLLTVRAFDLQNFAQVGRIDIPGVSGTPTSLIRWGKNGLAFRTTGNQVFIIETSLIPETANPQTLAPIPPTPMYSVKGHVTDGDTKPFGGVTITVQGAVLSFTTQTDSNGDYFIGNLPQCDTYTVTASKPYYIFTPKPSSFSGPFQFEPGKGWFTGFDGIHTANFTSSPEAKYFQLTKNSFSVNEDVGSITLTVARTGDPSAAASVDYTTFDSSAKQNRDYMPASGTLNFAPGETTKSFTILIIDDAYVESNETFTVFLRNPSGGSNLGTPSALTITITDNDKLPVTVNPLDDAQFFTRQHYYDFLSRLPDQGGLDYWSSQITLCGTDSVCINNKRIDVSNAFFYEAEYQQTAAYVFRLYRAAYGNNQPFPNPDTSNPTESKKLPAYDVFAQDRSRVVGGSSLASSQFALANLFTQRSAFLTKYPASLDGPSFVDAVLSTIKSDSGVDLTSQRSALISLFNSGGRGAVLYRLADDNAQTNLISNQVFIDAEYNRAFVYSQYSGYLRRDADIGGFLFWLGQVNSTALRDVAKQHAMVCSFITSAEYQTRFSSVVTHSNQECPQ